MGAAALPGGRAARRRREWRSWRVRTAWPAVGRHEVGLPHPRRRFRRGGGGERRAAAGAAAPAAGGLGLGEVVAPRTGELRIDAVDGLVGDDALAGLAGQAAGDLLGGPALREAGEDAVAQGGVAVEAGAAPAAGAGLLVGIPRLVALSAGPVAGQLAGNGRRLAIQSCSAERPAACRWAIAQRSSMVSWVYRRPIAGPS